MIKKMNLEIFSGGGISKESLSTKARISRR